MTQIPAVQAPQYQITAQPSYNAVKIDIHNPQVNAQSCTQNPVKPSYKEDPVYTYPQSSVYEVPKQSIYEPKQVTVTQPQSVQEVPTVPPPVIVQPTVVQTPSKSSAVNATKTSVETPVATVEPKKIEVKAPEVKAESKVDINEFISKMTSSDFEQQANAMEAIAEMVQSTPQKATELLDAKVIDTLLGIMSKDSSKLEGPTPQQLQIRENIMTGKPVTDAEKVEANKITPMELAERNKQYAIYTVAILEKLYGSEVEKISNTVVPLTELPGAAGIVEQVKNNPNPMVRAAALDALNYIQRPEYKQDLTTLFTIAQKDKDPSVQQIATKALEKIAKADAPKINEAQIEQPKA